MEGVPDAAGFMIVRDVTSIFTFSFVFDLRPFDPYLKNFLA